MNENKIKYNQSDMIIILQGPRYVGKSTLFLSISKYLQNKMHNAIVGPQNIFCVNKRRLTFFECPEDIYGMIDCSKVADLVISIISGVSGFEMETFEFLGILRATGFPRVIGIITHLDSISKSTSLKTVKNRLKHRFWVDLYRAAKIFYLNNIVNGLYMKKDINNLTKFITFLHCRGLSWRKTHPYLLVDKVKDISDVNDVTHNPRTNHLIAFYGMLRGHKLRNLAKLHVAGIGDFELQKVLRLTDPYAVIHTLHLKKTNSSVLIPKNTSKGRVVKTETAFFQKNMHSNHTVKNYLPQFSKNVKKNRYSEILRSKDHTTWAQSFGLLKQSIYGRKFATIRDINKTIIHEMFFKSERDLHIREELTFFQVGRKLSFRHVKFKDRQKACSLKCSNINQRLFNHNYQKISMNKMSFKKLGHKLPNEETIAQSDNNCELSLQEEFRPGEYVRISVKLSIFAFMRRFHHKNPLVIGGLTRLECTLGFVRARLKRHKWYRNMLKNQDALVLSLGWRRFETIPTFEMQDVNMQRRMLKNIPNGKHCLVTFWGPLGSPNTGFISVDNFSIQCSKWRLSATGVICETGMYSVIRKKFKLWGAPYFIIHKKAFLKGLFNSELEAANFEGAIVCCISGVKGIIGKSVNRRNLLYYPGSVKANFGRKLKRSDTVFVRAWTHVDLPKFYRPIKRFSHNFSRQWPKHRTLCNRERYPCRNTYFTKNSSGKLLEPRIFFEHFYLKRVAQLRHEFGLCPN
eukprot:gnl/MRDRNA2_/MRDRNA2_84957_c0_seq1.p1 gnl/MRDRNA2_/MRDRNA2_84957_c0~~gnl/MRDRNA2_/MRDRNA2_84957_c0_seq1.p1  ORF type:complete len:744 (-),score=-25.81 gnl/MRDRNA2_/MRDRNA2_84957_c0_seq1:52-2283(-)